MPVAATDSASARLIEVAVALAIDGGPADLSTRAVATAAGVSPSVVNYHFGGREGLLLAAHANLIARRKAWRAQRLADLPPNPEPSFWTFALGAIFELGVTRRGETLALAEFDTLGGAPDFRAAARAEAEAQIAFWTTAAVRSGSPDAATLVWAHFAQAAVRFALLDTATAALSWLAPATLRLAERLEGRSASPAAIPWLAAVEPPGTLPARPSGAQRLVTAALELIGREGLHAVTLRAVAEAAGLSLASTTYFFETKADLVFAAFTQLRDGVSRRALQSGVAQGLTGFSEALISDAGELRWEVGAMLALTLAGARQPDLRPVATSLRRLAGQTSAAWLSQQLGAPCDRVDAFIWSTFGLGLQQHLTHTPPDRRRAVMDEATSRAARATFGLAGV